MAKHLDPARFDANVRAALADEQLRTALERATKRFRTARRDAVASVPAWEELRERARATKAHVLDHLDHYLEEFERNARAAGAVVHFARDAQEACRVAVEIAQDANARTVVKAKSMTTEEIHLNDAFERAGIEPIETDLGEWIVQLADEPPSHILAPAVHKTKEQVSDLFVEKLGIEPTGDIAQLAGAARRALRRKFAEADVGVSGANFAVAETGSLLIVENEGNIRMTTVLPRVHVAIVGIEKLVPRRADLETFLRLLPRSASGQRLTSYMSLLTGPAAEGPRELHVVLLDNGRSAMLADPLTRTSLACIRCGACLNVCPVYEHIGGHAYGSVYPGPIGAVITPQLVGLERTAQLPFASSLCGACRDVCPVKIDLPALLLYLRGRVSEGSARPKRLERLAFRVWSWAMGGPRRYRFALRALRIAHRVAPRALSRSGPLGAWSAARELRPPAPRPFRAIWRDELEGER